jgi:hypothetical protein
MLKMFGNLPVLLLVVREVWTMNGMGYARLALQGLFSFVEFILELGPLLLFVVLLAGRCCVAAATPGIPAPVFGRSAPFAATIFTTGLLAVAVAPAVFTLIMQH